MASPLFFTIDQGTQSTRAMLFDCQGELVAKEQLPITAYIKGKAGEAEQDADYFWRCITAVSQRLWQRHPHLKSRVVGLSIATQRASIVCLDKEKQPLRPAIIWLAVFFKLVVTIYLLKLLTFPLHLSLDSEWWQQLACSL